jgi:hypothetical protein
LRAHRRQSAITRDNGDGRYSVRAEKKGVIEVQNDRAAVFRVRFTLPAMTFPTPMNSDEDSFPEPLVLRRQFRAYCMLHRDWYHSFDCPIYPEGLPIRCATCNQCKEHIRSSLQEREERIRMRENARRALPEFCDLNVGGVILDFI